MANLQSDFLYLITPLVSSVIGFCLFTIVLYRDWGKIENRLFSFVLLSLTLWSIFTFAMRASPNVQQALYWERMITPSGLALFILYYHFTSVYTRRINRGLLWAAYTLLVAASILSPMGLLHDYMTWGEYGYAPHLLPLMIVISFAGAPLIVLSLLNLIKARRVATKHEDRTRLSYMILAILLLCSFAIIDLFPNHTPMAIFGNILFGLITAIAIMKYHLLDISWAVRRGLAYLLVSIIVASFYIGLLLLTHLAFGEEDIPVWAYTLLVIAVAGFFLPFWHQMQRLIDKWFYRKRYDFLEELKRFSSNTHDITNFNQLTSTLVRLIDQALQLSGIYLLLPKETGELEVVTYIGKRATKLTFESNDPIIRQLRSNPGLLYCRDLNISPQLQFVTAETRGELQALGVEAIVPLKTRKDNLVGLLLLCHKLSHKPYSSEDEQLVLTVTNQVTVEIENARLYETARRSEKALRESETLFKTIVEAAPSFLMIVRVDGTIQYVSPNCLQFTGYNSEELSTSLTLWAHDEDKERLAQTLKRVFNGGLEVRHFEYRALKRDGTIWYASSSWQPLRDEAGKIISAIVQTIDITEHKEAEEKSKELTEKAQLASRLASVGEMASGIAHEINNPLTGVIGYSSLLIKKDLPEYVKDKLGIIHTCAQQVADIISRLLAFARQHKPARFCVDINEVVNTAISLRAYSTRTSSIEVITQFMVNLPHTIADASQLQQVFLNIILNAETEMKLAHGKGTLWITTEQDDNNIRVSFRDNGRGIAAENLPKLFDPFFTTREIGQGTGLGLSVCHGIIAEHNGRIYAESQSGAGATVTVELPIVTEDKPVARSTGRKSYEKGNQERILVVDDEPVILDFIRSALEAEGYVVETVNSAVAALVMIKNNNYNLLLLDIKLPEMNGIELYGNIQRENPLLLKSIIFITGDIMGPETSEFIFKVGVPCIAKPFTAEKLIEEVGFRLSPRM